MSSLDRGAWLCLILAAISASAMAGPQEAPSAEQPAAAAPETEEDLKDLKSPPQPLAYLAAQPGQSASPQLSEYAAAQPGMYEQVPPNAAFAAQQKITTETADDQSDGDDQTPENAGKREIATLTATLIGAGISAGDGSVALPGTR